MRRFLGVVLSVALLDGCGGGGSSSTEVDKISGKIIDGYITGAQIFWDCNSNGIIDSDEISTTSLSGGNYSISPAPKTSCRLTANIPASAIDSDTNTSVLAPYTMYAMDSNASIITPLTTLVVLNSDSTTQTVVASEIQKKFGLSLSIDADYLAGSTDAHVNDRKFAKVTAQLLQGNYSATSGYEAATYQKISAGIESIKNTIKTSSLADVINRIISIPSELFKRFVRVFYADPSLGVKVNGTGLTTSQISYLNSLITDPRVTPYIGGGRVDWKRIDPSVLKDIHVKVSQNGFSASNYPALSVEWNTKKNAIDAKYADLLKDANVFVTFDAESVGAMFDVADALVKGGYGAAKMASVAPDVTGVFAYINMTPGTQGKLIKNLDKLSKYTGFVTKASQCGFSLVDFNSYFKDGSVSPENYLSALQATSGLIGCLGSMVDDAPTGKGVSYLVGLFDAGSASEDDRFEAMMTLLDTLNTVVGLTPPTPFSNFVSGFLDVVAAGVDSYKAGVTISKQAGKKVDIAQADILELQKAQLNIIDREYLSRFIQDKIGSGIVRADWNFSQTSSIQSVLAAGTYTYSNSSSNTCYSKSMLGSSVSSNEYRMTESQYCLNSAKNGWVLNASTSNNREVLTSSGWVNASQATIQFPSNAPAAIRIGGVSYSSGTLATYSGDASYPSGSRIYDFTISQLVDEYSIYTGNSYISSNATSVPAIFEKWNTRDNGHSYLKRGGDLAWAFDSPSSSSALSGVVRFYNPSEALTCTATNVCSRTQITSATWVRATLSDGSDSIELRTPSGYADTNLSGYTGEKVIYVKRSSDAGIVEGSRRVIGATSTDRSYNRTYFDSFLQKNGLPATLN